MPQLSSTHMEMNCDQKLAVFLDALGSEPDVESAREILHAHDWNVEAALCSVTGRDGAQQSSPQAGRHELAEPLNTAASVAMIELVTAAKADNKSSILRRPIGMGDLEAVLSGSVARNIISQGNLGVCGAAAVAGALNACYEHIDGVETVDWPTILYKHFRDKLSINVLAPSTDGRPVVTTRRVGNRSILRVVRSFPHMHAELLITKQLAADPQRAWQALTAALQMHRSAVFFHTSNHYVLVQGFVGGSQYQEGSCAIFSSSFGQEAFEMIPFSHACRVIARCAKGGYCMFRIYYSGPENLESEGEWAAHAPDGLKGGVDSEDAVSDDDIPQANQPLAEPTSDVSESSLECSICLDMFCEPLRLPCSHTFCRSCLVQTPTRRCPLCRAEQPNDFDPSTAPVDEPLATRAKLANPHDYAQRLVEMLSKAARTIRLRIGNRHSLVENPKTSKNGRHLNRHRWTMFVELVADPSQPTRCTKDFVEAVRFKLAPYYTTWPNSDKHSVRVGKDPEVRSAPFEVTRVGWGYFPTKVIVTWHPCLHMEPLEIEHELCFDDDGSSSFHVVELSDVAMEALSPTAGPSASRGLQRTGNASDSSRSTNRRVRSIPRRGNQGRLPGPLPSDSARTASSVPNSTVPRRI